MVLEKLGSSLKNTLSKIAKSVFVDEKLINELVKDMQRALLQSDVNVKLVFELTKKEHLVNIVYEELTRFLGEKAAEIKVEKKPFKIMMVGLFGSGKTTTIGKLAKYFMKRGYKIATIGLDVHRPAAPEQLKQISDSLNIDCFIEPDEKDALKIYNKYEQELNNYDVVLVDTAGRDAVSEDLITEIKNLYNTVKPDENLLIISGDIGQAAQTQAQAFHDSGAITGVIVTKMEGTAKGGGALTACAVSGAPIKFLGVGEKVDDLEPFNPPGFVGRLLGMGDIEALLEKAKEAMPEEDAEKLSKRFLKGDFNLLDLYDQMKAMKKMGSLSKIMELVPGMGQLKMPKEMLDVQEDKLEKWKPAMMSMTQEELEEPENISPSRIDRISKGSGVPVKTIRELLKQYKMSKKMMKQLGATGGKGDMKKLMKKFKGKMPPGMGM